MTMQYALLQDVCYPCLGAAWEWGERGFAEQLDLLLNEGNQIGAHKCANAVKSKNIYSPIPSFNAVACSCGCAECFECGSLLNEDRTRCWNCDPESG